MRKYEIMRVQDRTDIVAQVAEWFHQKWGIPKAAYLESMMESQKGQFAVPQWYIILDGEAIIAGLGVIANDFHNRKELTPNVCAVYVEEKYRSKGIAGQMLQFVCDDFNSKGIDTLYLLTDLTSFYEMYGWKYYCMVQGDGEPSMTRMYIHKC